MRFNTKLYALMAVLCSGLFFTSCGDDEPNYKKTDPTPTPTDQSGKTDPTTPTISTEIKNATGFVNQVAGEIYLWSTEVSSAIKSKLNPETCTDPISAWEEVAYKNGDIQDKWSMVTNDYASFYNSTQNIEVTYGWDVTIFYVDQSHTTICFEVNYVSEGSPAANAGIKRGDVILTYNGKDITPANYQEAYYSTSGVFGYSHGSVTPTETATLSAVEMYENPILVHKIFDIDGKKVGYIHYTGFDKASIEPLKAISSEFKTVGVTELILDLRYNGGGLVATEETMAAMYGPWADTTTKTLYQQDVYNAKYNEAWKNDRFHYLNVTTDSNGKETTYIDQSYNIGLKKIYAIVSKGSASASESLLVGLMPYVPIEIIGSENTHGKYCTGWVLSAPMWYTELTNQEKTPAGISNWGFYVMISRYADKDGNCPCMPNGLTPTIDAEDNPGDGYQLGDEGETMLAAALQAAGKAGTRALALESAPEFGDKFSHQIRPKNFGLRIDNRPIAHQMLLESVVE